MKAFRHIVLPLEFDPDRADAIDWRTERGELLSPERFRRAYWDDAFRTMPSEVRGAQYNQDPVPTGTGLFLAENFGRWADWSELPQDGVLYSSLDAALQGRPDSAHKRASRSYWVNQIWLKSGPRRVLLSQVRFQDDFPVAIDTIREQIEGLMAELRAYKRSHKCGWTPSEFLIEDKANGPAAISTWRSVGIPGGFSLTPVSPGTKSKLERAESCLPTVRSHDVWLPSDDIATRAGTDGLVERLCAFPRGRTDDEVDAMCQLLLHTLEDTLDLGQMLRNLRGLRGGA